MIKHFLTALVLLMAFHTADLFAQSKTSSYCEDSQEIRYTTDPNAKLTKGKGPVISEERSLPAIEKIIVGNGMHLVLSNDNNGTFRIEAQENILPLINSSVNDGELVLSLTSSLQTREGIKVYMSAGQVNQIIAKEGSFLEIPDGLNNHSLDLLVTSGSNGNCHLNLKDLKCHVKNGSNLTLEGSVQKEAEIFVTSASNFRGKKFKGEECAVTVSNASNCILHVGSALYANVEGVSNLSYYGNPKYIEEKSLNMSNINHRGNSKL